MAKLSTPRLFFAAGLLCLFLLIVFALTVSGVFYFRSNTAQSKEPAQNVDFKYISNRAYRPKIVLFQTSLNPLNNQIENSLRSVYEILQNRFDFTPHYYFEKTNSLADYCLAKVKKTSDCPDLVSQAVYPDTQTCEKKLTAQNTDCLNPKNYLSVGEVFYTSVNGRQEMNQNIREICAYSLATDKLHWWQFVTNVNRNCTVENTDLCWQDQAKKSNINTTKITDCFNQKAVEIIESEIKAISDSGKPSSVAIKINDQDFPPTDLSSDRKIYVNFQTIEPHLRYTANSFKEAVCDAMVRPPKECRIKFDEQGNINDN